MLRNTRQPYSSRHWQKRCVFTVACILGVPSAMYLKNYTFVNDNRQSGFTPVLCASGPKFNRKNFNPVADLVEQTAGAVVHIESTAYQGRFFRSFGPGSDRVPVSGNTGSGVIVRADGLIVTNAHVVHGSNEVTVTMNDGSKHKGFVNTVDQVCDLATVKIQGKKLPMLPLADSDDVRPGEYVIAMGSPLKLNNTVTAGIVSTSKRASGEIGLHGKRLDYIQTDAHITVGNSGGPLVNMDGEIIGINSMTAGAGISFSIPSNYVKEFLNRSNVIEQRRDTGGDRAVPKNRQFIGATLLTLTDSIIDDLTLLTGGQFPDVDYGVLVQAVAHNGPAYRAGIRAGSIIQEINGKKIETSCEVFEAVNTNKTLRILLLQKNRLMQYEERTIQVEPQPVTRPTL